MKCVWKAGSEYALYIVKTDKTAILSSLMSLPMRFYIFLLLKAFLKINGRFSTQQRAVYIKELFPCIVSTACWTHSLHHVRRCSTGYFPYFPYLMFYCVCEQRLRHEYEHYVTVMGYYVNAKCTAPLALCVYWGENENCIVPIDIINEMIPSICYVRMCIWWCVVNESSAV